MNVKEAREIVEGMELSAEAIQKIDEILTPYESGGDVPDDVIDKILVIVDVEMDAAKLAADIYQSGAEMANEFLVKIDDEADKIADEIEEKTAQNKTGQ